MDETHRYLETNRDRILNELLAFVRIPSVSADPSHRDDTRSAAEWVADKLRQAGPFHVEILETPGNPVVYGEWVGALGRPTLLIYGHYDVQPPDPLERWQSAPFEPEIREGRVYARGSSDDKGPMFIPIKVAEAYFASQDAMPINVKMILEGEEEIGSPHLSDFVAAHAAMLAADWALSADGAMWRIDEPSITMGSRGLVALDVEVRGPAKDLHSGRHGGAVQNPLHALVELLSTLHLADGKVAVAGFYDKVQEVTDVEREAIGTLVFDEERYRAEVGVPELFGEAGYSTLERQWIRPTLEVNGIGGGYQGEGPKTVIPSAGRAKITCRLVPDQEPEEILEVVERHLMTHVPPGVTVRTVSHPGRARPYRIPDSHQGLQIARKVLRQHYGREPSLVLAGGTLPVSEIFSRVLNIDTVYFSFSTADEDFHAPNEFFRLSRLWDGLAAWSEYLRMAALQTAPAPRVKQDEWARAQ